MLLEMAGAGRQNELDGASKTEPGKQPGKWESLSVQKSIWKGAK